MSERLDWAALIADRNIEGFMDEVLNVMSGWHQEAEVAKLAASDDDAETVMVIDHTPGMVRMSRKVASVTNLLKNVHLSNKDVPKDVAAIIPKLNDSALVRARYHLRDNKEKFTGLHSLPGKVLMKIFQLLHSNVSDPPLLSKVHKPILADVSTKLRKTYIHELFTSQQFLVVLLPAVLLSNMLPQFIEMELSNPFLMEGISKSDGAKVRRIHHLMFKIDPQHQMDPAEAIESPLYIEIDFAVNGEKLARPTVTASLDRTRVWRRTNHMLVYWRVAIGCMWDAGLLEHGLNAIMVARLIHGLGMFTTRMRTPQHRMDEVFANFARFDAVLRRMMPRTRAAQQRAADQHQDEDLMSDVADDDSMDVSDDDDATSKGSEPANDQADWVYQVLSTIWGRDELAAPILDLLTER